MAPERRLGAGRRGATSGSHRGADAGHHGENGQLKIHFVNRYFYPDYSATSQLLTDLAFFLARRGDSVVVHTSRQLYGRAAAALPHKELVNGVEVHRVWTSRFGRKNLIGRVIDYATFYLSVSWRLAVEVSKGDIVVAKTDPPIISSVCSVISKARRAVLVNWCQDLFPEVARELGVGMVNRPVAAVLRRIRNRSLKAASVNVVVGRKMADLLAKQGLDDSRIVIIHNWADGKLLRPVPRECNALREAWGLERFYVVGYSGNLGRAHEFETILQAARLLKDRRDIVFLFIGDGVGLRRFKECSSEAGLRNILFKPYQPRERLAESLSVPDLHLVSLRPELEGLVVPSKFYGIAAVGRPTLFIGSPDGEVARIIKQEGCGRAVAIGDGSGAASFIRSMAGDLEMNRTMGEKARSLFERKYDSAISLDAWAAALERAGAGTGKPAAISE